MTPYTELLAVLECLPLLVREARRRKGHSIRASARVCGMSFSTISRFENRVGDIQLDGVCALIRYVAEA